MNKFLRLQMLFLTFLSYGGVFAQGGDGPDPPPAPIDDLLLPMGIIALAIGYYVIRKKQKKAFRISDSTTQITN